MNIIDRLAAATLCSKPRAESALKSSTSYEEAVKLVRLLQKQDAMKLDCELIICEKKC